MEKFYLLGSKIAHSKSPSYWQGIFDSRGLDWSYELMDLRTEDEARAFIEGRNFHAINITTPWKQLAFACADEPNEVSKFCDGCNFLVNDEGVLRGYNVDGYGCIDYLKSQGVLLAHKNVFVCGTGPTARSIAWAAREEAANVTMLSRNEKDLEIPVATYSDWDARVADVVINATTLGMNKGDASPISEFSDKAIYFDCIYGHGLTNFVAQAKQAGAQVFDGAGMLDAQALRCVKIIGLA